MNNKIIQMNQYQLKMMHKMIIKKKKIMIKLQLKLKKKSKAAQKKKKKKQKIYNPKKKMNHKN